ncbi:hypothetical protein D9757_007749 [Collybiopsis confluens]|uniref:Uncharacterized protein n=1 Tax=Collybiopsis confluens TaxID=2823264 RepID=A0A8H5H5E3_9AGAR|nr:hypothetical protein D9757_007749 [Collybiopsis confluens]
MSSDSHVPFVVHRYVSNEHIITQTVAQAFLKQGARILQQHQNRPKWHNVCLQPPLPAAESLPPPPPPPQVAVSSSQLKDWPGLPDEIYNLDDLDEFQCWHSSTDPLPYSEPPIPSACSQSQSDPHPLPQSAKRPIEEGETVNEPPRKSIRDTVLHADSSPLQRVIPQPHILVSKTMTKPDFLATKLYTRNEPVFLSPQAGFDDSHRFSRRAWIVPIRGSFPSSWTELGASSALVLDPCDPCSSCHLPTDHKIKPVVRWSHTALIRFWEYLMRLRDLQSFGGLGISFHPAPADRRGSEPSTSHSLKSCDYFKVYHDASISMHLRQALDLFAFADPAGFEQQASGRVSEREGSESAGLTSGIEAEEMNQLRLLKGARLVLVDDRSRGVLIA